MVVHLWQTKFHLLDLPSSNKQASISNTNQATVKHKYDQGFFFFALNHQLEPLLGIDYCIESDLPEESINYSGDQPFLLLAR